MSSMNPMQSRRQADRQDQRAGRQGISPPRSVNPTLLIQRAQSDPHSLHPQEVLQLQRLIGNRAVGRLLSSPAGPATTPGNAPVVQRDLDEDIENMRSDSKTVEDPLLKKILLEALSMYDSDKVDTAYGPSPEQSHALPKGKHGQGRRYDVVIDQNVWTDPSQRQSIILHELLHTSADQKYAYNAKTEASAQNVVYNAKNTQNYVSAQVDFMGQLMVKLYDTIEAEKDILGEELAAHLLSRVNRGGGVPGQEFDTVASELLYYVTKLNVSKETNTYKLIRSLANSAYAARNEGVPLIDYGALLDDELKQYTSVFWGTRFSVAGTVLALAKIQDAISRELAYEKSQFQTQFEDKTALKSLLTGLPGERRSYFDTFMKSMWEDNVVGAIEDRGTQEDRSKLKRCQEALDHFKRPDWLP